MVRKRNRAPADDAGDSAGPLRKAADWRLAVMTKYPDLFGRPPRPGYPGVGDGWRQIIERALARIAAAMKSCPGARITITQIKEKFASTRIYYEAVGLSDAATAAIDEAIALAEARAKTTCDVCGLRGRRYSDVGYLTTRCATHAQGEPVRPKSGCDGTFTERRFVDGAWVARRRLYDRAHDCFIDLPLTEGDWRS